MYDLEFSMMKKGPTCDPMLVVFFFPSLQRSHLLRPANKDMEENQKHLQHILIQKLQIYPNDQGI